MNKKREMDSFVARRTTGGDVWTKGRGGETEEEEVDVFFHDVHKEKDCWGKPMWYGNLEL